MSSSRAVNRSVAKPCRKQIPLTMNEENSNHESEYDDPGGASGSVEHSPHGKLYPQTENTFSNLQNDVGLFINAAKRVKEMKDVIGRLMSDLTLF